MLKFYDSKNTNIMTPNIDNAYWVMLFCNSSLPTCDTFHIASSIVDSKCHPYMGPRHLLMKFYIA